MKLFSSLSPDLGMLSLLQKSIGIKPPEFLIDVPIGRTYDITQDKVTDFNAIASSGNKFAHVGCSLPSHVKATESDSAEFTCDRVSTMSDYYQKRLKKLGISVAPPQVSPNFTLRSGYNLTTSENSTKMTAVYEKKLLKLECKSGAGPSEELVNLVKKLPLTNDKNDAINTEQCKQCFKAYGTHYVKSVCLGGSITFEINRTESVAASKKYDQYDIHDGLSAFLHSIFTKSLDDNMSGTFVANNYVKIKVQGGKSSLATTELSLSRTYEEFSRRLQQWEETIWENPVVLELSIGLGELSDLILQPI